MVVFIIMKKLIDECIEQVKDNFEGLCENATPGSNDCFSCFQKQFFGGNIISYNCAPKTQIYVARYFPVHVKENAVGLKLMPQEIKNRLISENPLNIISVGGGPGSDTFAVKNFLIDNELAGEITAQKDVYLLRVDKEENWNHIAGIVNSKVTDTELIKFDARRKTLDITAKQEWPKKFGRLYNIFTMSYFLSEMGSQEEVEAVAEFINKISSDKCSVVLINDRDEGKVHQFKQILFENLSTNTNCEYEDNTKYHCGFFYDDEDRNLISPKLNTNSIRFFKVLYI